MKICIPTNQANGLDSTIAPNFRAASTLLIFDSDTRDFLSIDSSGGSCGATPRNIDAIIHAGGMGRGMFNNLRREGILVFNSNSATVGEALSEMLAGSLEAVEDVACCSDGDGAHEHGHHHHQHQHEHGNGGCCCGH